MARVLFALVIAESISSFEGAMIFMAVAAMYREFNDPVLVGWIISAFVLVNAATTAIGARLGDLFGRRRVLLICIGLAGAGSLVSALSTEAWGVIVGRAIQGLAGPLLPLCYGLVREHLPVERMAVGIGVIAANAVFTAGIATLIGGVVVDHYSWHGIFYFSAALSLIAIPVTWLMLPPSAPAKVQADVDLVGGIAFVVPITLLLFAIGKIQAWGWADPRILSMIVFSLIALLYWVRYESRQRNPLIDVRLLLKRKVAIGNIGLVLIGMGAMQTSMILSLLVQQPIASGAGLGMSATVLGTVSFFACMMAMLGAPLCGHIATRHGPRLPMIAGTVLLTATFVVFMLWHHSFALIALLMLLYGFAQSLVFAAAPILITTSVPHDRTSEANGLSNVLRQTGMAISTQVIALIMARYSIANAAPGTGSYVADAGFIAVFGYIAATSLLCLFAAMLLPRNGRLERPGL